MADSRALIVTYWYPPAAGAAAERAHGFARYLPVSGWDVHVIAAEGDEPPPSDPGVTVTTVADPMGGGVSLMPEFDPRVRPSHWSRRLRDWVFPDRFVHWQDAAARAGTEILRRERIDLIIASFPPASAVLAALTMHRRSGVPLAVDFRDIWLGPGGYAPATERARQRHKSLYHDAVARAQAIITVSEPMADAVAEDRGYPRDRVFVASNGYDAADEIADDDRIVRMADTARGGATNAPLAIAHVGTVIARNSPELFFKTLRAARRDDRLGNVIFRFVGNLSVDYVRSLGLGDIVQTTGMVSRRAAAVHMRAADALLLLTGEYVGRWGYSAKLFEYVRTGRPILCLETEPNSNDGALLRELAADRSRIIPMCDLPGLCAAVGWLRGFGPRYRSKVTAASGLKHFDRRVIAADLARFLHSRIGG